MKNVHDPLGVGVLMLLVLTLERYVSVCHPGYVKPFLRHPRYLSKKHEIYNIH